MIAPVSSRPSTMLSERLLITKIITGVGLALMLIIGMWSGAHSETEKFPASHAATVTASDDNTATVDSSLAVGASDAASGAADRTGASADESGGALFGLGGCVLGIFCALLLIALKRLSTHRVQSRVVTVVSRTIARLATTSRPFTPSLTLAQLSLSRT